MIRWPERDLPAVVALASVRDRRGPFVLGLAAKLAKDFDAFFP